MVLSVQPSLYLACNEGTFKPNTGNGPCVTCSGHMYSLVGAVTCACDIGHEVVASLQNICSRE